MLMEMSLCYFNHPYEKICVPDVVKNLNVKVFNIMSRANEARHIEWHKMRKCECKFGANICNNKQRWNNDKCRCEFKELIDKGVCDNSTLYIVLMIVALTICVGIGTYFVHYNWSLVKNVSRIKYSYSDNNLINL